MSELLSSILAASPFIPQGHCYLWKPELVWLHIAADSLIALAYYSIPLTLVYFVQKRRDLPVKGVLVLFSAFIVSCGTTHIMEVWTLWHPTYWLSGFLKAFTAIVSLCMATVFVPLIPKALALPSSAQLEAEIVDRRIAEEALKKAASDLEKSYNLLRAVIESTPDAIFVKDLQGRHLMINSGGACVIGKTVEEIIGKDNSELFPPEIAQQLTENDRRIITKGDTEIFEEVFPRDKIKRTFLSTKSVYRDAEGNIIGLIGIARDITLAKQAEDSLKKAKVKLEIRVQYRTSELRQANEQLQREIKERICVEQALRTANQTLQTLIEASPLAIVTINVDGKVTMWNPAAERLFGWSESEVLGKALPLVPPDRQEEFFAMLQVELKTSKLTGKELRKQKKDGSSIDVSLWTAPLFDNNGVIMGSLGLFVDISDKISAEKALRESQELLQEIIDNSPAVIYLKDTFGRYILINHKWEQLFHIDQNEVKGKSEWELFPKEIADTFWENDRQIIASGNPVEIEEVAPHDDGMHTYISVKFPLKDAAGIPYAICGISTDISDRKQIEEALRESEEQFRATFEQAAVGICHCGENGQFIKINQRFCEIVGYSEEELLKLSFADITYPDELTDELPQFQKLMAGEISTYSMEKRYIHRSGEIVWVHLTGSIVRSHTGEPKYKVAVIQDISDRKALEKELALRQALFDAFFTASPAGLSILDEQMRIVQINESLAEMDGLTVQEHQGKTVSEILPHLAPVLQPMHEQVLRQGKSFLNIEIAGETQKQPGVVRYWLDSHFPLFGENGKPIGIGTVVIEITDRKLTEEALQRSEAQYRRLVETASEGIWMLDAQGKTRFANVKMAAMLGYTVEEMLGMPLDHFLDAEWQAISAKIREPYLQGIAEQHDFKFRRKDGSELWTLLSSTPIFDDAGKYTGALGMLTDITDRKCAEAALLQSEQRYRSLVVATSQIVWLNNAQGLAVDMPEWGAYTGQSQEEIAGWGWLNAIHPEDRDRTAKVWTHAVETKSLYKTEYRIRGKDGNYRYFYVRGVPVLAEDGSIREWVGVCTDIQDRKRAEEELRHSEARYRELAIREALLNRLANQVRASLELDTILESAVCGIRDLLQVECCLFLWYKLDAIPPSWEVVQEAKNSELPSLINKLVPGTAIAPLTAKAMHKEIIRIEDTTTISDTVEKKFFLSIGYRTVLLMPIHTQSGEIAVISCSHTSKPRLWTDAEVDLLEAVAAQIAIAIDQAALYKQSRTTAEIAQTKAQQLEQALRELQQTQSQLIQSEKMSSLGQLVAGVAHEINNPVNFIHGNVAHADIYIRQLLNLVQLYEKHYPQAVPEIQTEIEEIELDFIKEDLPKILSSMKMGTERIRKIVLSLRNFSRLDEADMKQVDIHEGIDSSLLILQNRLKSKSSRAAIQVIKEYDKLPLVECYAGQLNQVFLNILTNAIDALEESIDNRSLVVGNSETSSNYQLPITNYQLPTILIRTQVIDNINVMISIADNGPGMSQEVQSKLFDPFYTTKPVGSGTGLGMAISYQIVEKHGGQLTCSSTLGKGAQFFIQIPIRQRLGTGNW